ncbi:hypothetical protein KPL76_05825 [Subtercola sp. PAMC28395]|uniref:hypothetical protein n=1 Tax=Subtercola sp. PAMC28395 TaxID=2846775 RepID=UPI001C0E6E8C|nr:hypothetical protein [Subtercola sp. PAMC28395]QWT24876.1 hypothetical protein KPL76_05825 [Subtercola sp. PAMC28395]
MAHLVIPDSRSIVRVVYFLAAVAVAAVASVAAVSSPMLAVGILLVMVFTFVSFWRPQFGIALWLVATVFIPSWTVLASVGTQIQPYYLAVPVVIGLTLRRIHGRISHGRVFSLSFVDLSVVTGVVLVMFYESIFQQASFLSTNVLFTLFLGYVIGRLSEPVQHNVFAVLMIIVAIWGILEFGLSWHAFVDWQATGGGIGPALQERGGFTRSEATLGHAIAYGACLAAAIPFVRSFKRAAVLQVILCAGVLVSFSRGPILAVVFTFALMVFVERSSKRRLTSIVFLIAGLTLVYFVFTFLYNGSGQSEVQASSSYRDNAVASSIQFTNVIGPADGLQLNADGRYETNGVDIIDSAPLRLALDFGWLVTVLLLMPAVAAIVAVLRRRAGPATVALAAQVPVLLVTSFITQWQVIFFFIAGLAINEMVASRRGKSVGRDIDVNTVDTALIRVSK